MNTTPRQYREQQGRLGLERARCDACGKFNDSTADTCYDCGGRDLSAVELTPEGEVVTYIVQHHLPEVFDTPLPIAIVETPEGAKLLGMFTDVDDPHELEIGDRVGIELRRFTRTNGAVVYENKFTRLGGEDR